MEKLQQGTTAFRKANFALFAGGFITFSILYDVQPLLPIFTKEFDVTAATGSLALSVTTFTLAISMLFISSLSEAWGRKPIMSASLLLSSLIVIITAFSPTFSSLLGFRILQGIVLAGLPAIAMAYLGEEVDSRSLGIAMGIYISGNSIGGMAGRIITGSITDLFSWRIAMGSIGVISLMLSIWFWFHLPNSRYFAPKPLKLKALSKSLVGHLKDPALLCLFCIAFILMGSFVTLYNYIGFELLAPPYHLSQTIVGWIFIVYLTGTFSSTWMGRLSDSLGRKKVLWIGLVIMAAGAIVTLAAPLVLKIIGIAVFTFGFFGAHSIASSWVGRRARTAKAQASSLYLFFYYSGSSIAGTAGGFFFSNFGWKGVIGFIICLLLLAFPLSLKLSSVTESPVQAMN
ncbi:MFS transporter [Bacillus sp. AFS076308]|uniref:MFS transporter n=1 Tax=unclassified Bacillus (in: firmicutes) TaxID=185979 RepID=UPI000BF3E454|nr:MULTISPECIES: MFS transporter [unclassified Bacillus (in: firmicutes)]PFN99463.1 MFS transporter [Bacillus sp. AFS076308]PGV55913.1 MFS transporter [Bacillus sp. AFS037270]